jgi:hypothetical protein
MEWDLYCELFAYFVFGCQAGSGNLDSCYPKGTKARKRHFSYCRHDGVLDLKYFDSYGSTREPIVKCIWERARRLLYLF